MWVELSLKTIKLEIERKFLVIRWEAVPSLLLWDYLCKFLLVGHFLTMYYELLQYHEADLFLSCYSIFSSVILQATKICFFSIFI